MSVERGEFVTVLNREDPDWYWIVRSDGQEGFVPSGFVYPADVIQGNRTNMFLCFSYLFSLVTVLNCHFLSSRALESK